MKVLIVTNMAPFLRGGAEELADNLKRQLIAAGHESEILRIPFQWDPPSRIPSQMLMARSFELWNVDRVIALKFPAYLIRHRKKTLWLLHQYRQSYDLYGSVETNLLSTPEHQAIRNAIRRADDDCFAESRHLFTISPVTQRRLMDHNKVPSEVLVPPVNDPEMFTGAPARGYIFAAGRINTMKRQHLLVEAMAHAPSGCRLLIAGPADTPEDAIRIQRLVERRALGDRVMLDIRYLPRSVYAQYMNESTAVACVPYDEDALSYVAMEAATAGKPVLTLTDSGGVLGLVVDGETGLVSEPAALPLAECMGRLCDTNLAAALGASARRHLLNLNADWPTTIEKLVA